MRRTALAFCVVGIFSGKLDAASVTFEPKIDDVCSLSTQDPGLLVLDRRMLIGHLMEEFAGLPPIQLSPDGQGGGFDMEVKALLNPKDFCKPAEVDKTTGECPRSLKIEAALESLVNFLVRHQKPIDSTTGGINTTGMSVSGDGIRQFLKGNIPAKAAFCQKPAPKEGASQPKGNRSAAGNNSATGSSSTPMPFIALRKTVDDLKYSQTSASDAKQFVAASGASISASNDRITNKYSVAIDSTLGYVFPRQFIDKDEVLNVQIIPFVAYNQQFVQAATPKTSSYVQNFTSGVMGDMIVAERHDFSFYPKYVDSLRNNGQLFSGTLGYTPMFGIPGVDSIYYIIPEMLSVLITPQFKYVFRQITNVGSDVTFLNPGNYSWYGGRGNVSLLGEGILDGFVYSAGYEQYAVGQGNIKHVSNFSTSINYSFGASKLVTVQLQYQRGRNLDTLESVNLFTLGLGLKY